MLSEQRRLYQGLETHELLRLSTTELTGGARTELLAELAERGVDAARIQRVSDAASKTRSDAERSAEQRASARRSPAGPYLGTVASASITAFSAIFLFALLTSNSKSALRLAMVGDADAAMLKASAMTLFFLAAALIVGTINKRLAFYSLLGTSGMLGWVALEPSHHLLEALYPTAVCIGIKSFLFARRFHRAPIGKRLAWPVCIVLLPLAVLMTIANWR